MFTLRCIPHKNSGVLNRESVEEKIKRTVSHFSIYSGCLSINFTFRCMATPVSARVRRSLSQSSQVFCIVRTFLHRCSEEEEADLPVVIGYTLSKKVEFVCVVHDLFMRRRLMERTSIRIYIFN